MFAKELAVLTYLYIIFFPLERGCPSAALRVWPWNERNRTPLELCGDSLEQHSKITSETNLMRVS